MSNTLSAPNRRERADFWSRILRNEIARHLADPFVWGQSDCAMWADVVRAMTGYDPIHDGRGYTSADGALRNLRAVGFRSVLDLVVARFPEVPPAHAQRGDIGFPADVSPLSGPLVIVGSEAVTKSLAGPIIVARGVIVRAFAV